VTYPNGSIFGSLHRVVSRAGYLLAAKTYIISSILAVTGRKRRLPFHPGINLVSPRSSSDLACPARRQTEPHGAFDLSMA